jgi:hypothetical protein
VSYSESLKPAPEGRPVVATGDGVPHGVDTPGR